MELKFKKNLWSGIVSIVMGIVIQIIIPYQVKIREYSLSKAIPSDYVPKLIAYIIIIFGSALVIKSLVFKMDEDVSINIKGELHAISYFAIIVAYVIIMPLIGFLFSSILFCTIALLFKRTKQIKYYIITNGIVMMLWFTFMYGLNVRFP